ncbi:ChrR family anti-sigma-E factor [Tranquillimonas rosea]|uniref:ChrR family anti-sigma-E factor n=1 Tax=Tranquillimonas rosea TaxID=641238 RepID=UPI003BA8877A
METIRHHLPDDLLMGYAAGSLAEAFNVLIATHLSLCDECRARAGSFDAVGGAILDTSPPRAMAPGALQATLARIGEDPEAPRATHQPERDDTLPAPLTSYVGGGLDSVPWRSIGGGVRDALLPTSKEARVRLLRIPAGMAVPDHGHRGMELTLVLQGAFRDETDRFARGDVEVADEELEHTPVAEEGEDCICLAATDAPLRFKGMIPRLAQSFLRI